MKKIDVVITPDFLYLTASRAAEKISISILEQLSFFKALKCYFSYIREPMFIKKHLLTLLEDAPFIGTPIKYWNFFTSRLNIPAKAHGSSRENLSRILATPLKYAGANTICFDGAEYLPPTLQRVFGNLNFFYENISIEGLSYQSIENNRQHLKAIMAKRDLAVSVGSVYQSHNSDKSLAVTLLGEGMTREGMFYAVKTCKALLNGLSVDEMLITSRAFLQMKLKGPLPEKYDLQKMYADTLFQSGNYKEALSVYRKLSIQEQNEEYRFEAMRKVVRSLERLGEYEKAIKEAGLMLPLITSPRAQAKMKRSLGWCHIRRGSADDLSEAIKLSKEALHLYTTFTSPENKNDLKYNQARIYNNLGAAHELLGDVANLKIASHYHKKCYKIMSRLESMKWKSASLLNDSIVCRKLNKLNLSEKKAAEAVHIRMWVCDTDDLVPMLYNASFTRVRLFFTTRKPDFLNRALEDIDTALSLQKEHASQKGVTGLYSLKMLCEILLSREGSPKELFALIQTIGKNNKEEDKVPLFHKVAASACLKFGKKIPASINRYGSEKELPSPEQILKAVL